jgi:RNA polymerase sigma-70 factor (ECF subfamily)
MSEVLPAIPPVSRGRRSALYVQESVYRVAMTDRHIERLVAKAARGDTRAFTRLYDAFADRVYGFVKLRVRDVRDAEEIVETVFLKAWQALPGYEERGLPFTAWLFRIARNAVIDEVRRSGREPQTLPDTEAEALPGDIRVDESVMARLDGERVRETVALLTEEQAAVVTMRFLWGVSVKDAAAVMMRSEGAVKALQHRALRTMAKLLAEERLNESA